MAKRRSKGTKSQRGSASEAGGDNGSLEFGDILYEKRDRVAYVTINRPEARNALRSQTREELAAAIEDAWLDEEIGVIVLTGAGDRAFSAGGDLSWIVDPERKVDNKFMLVHYRLATAMRNCGKPIIARVNGYCIGGGNELNMLCDLTIASEDSIFAQAGPLVGSAPIWYGMQLLQLSVGDKKSREIVYLCNRYSAEEAEKLGWVNKVVPKDKLDEEVEAYCNRLLEMSPQSLRIAKFQLNFASDMATPQITQGLELARFFMKAPEMVEGATAFMEKRKPDFYSVK
ncbi:MAG: enoyl-CoA hydratase/isomerase family protein [Candidatus Dadabacteria bacterium]|nr:enoyl-CoA hydratase/isomerase family protein [Candidatus Dadabacteria bacterium]